MVPVSGVRYPAICGLSFAKWLLMISTGSQSLSSSAECFGGPTVRATSGASTESTLESIPECRRGIPLQSQYTSTNQVPLVPRHWSCCSPTFGLWPSTLSSRATTLILRLIWIARRYGAQVRLRRHIGPSVEVRTSLPPQSMLTRTAAGLMDTLS